MVPQAQGGDIVVSITITSNGIAIRTFDLGEITVTVPYNGALPVAAWYVDDAGVLHRQPSEYCEEEEAVIFITTHLSRFLVGFDGFVRVNELRLPPALWLNPFRDVSEFAIYFDAVRFVHENRFFSGVELDLFAPYGTMTRAMAVTVLWRMVGRPDASHLPNVFSDVRDGSYYDIPLRWAAANGIVAGVGDGRFAPDDNISHRHMTALFNRYGNRQGSESHDRNPITRAGVAMMMHDFMKEND
jgi:hypothetical protein